jgi:hypothetical protein
MKWPASSRDRLADEPGNEIPALDHGFDGNLSIAADPAPDAVAALRARIPEQDRGNQSTRRGPGTE